MKKIKLSDITSIKDMPISLSCMMSFAKMYGLNWQVFSREGYSLEDIISACGGKDRRSRIFKVYAKRKLKKPNQSNY